ncbi:hypothetical protein [Duganella sp. HH101]|uniref:hypothetical protein n=1 Tax=Duganella sp. HH101 TaxID=1781066 RepID=UPI000874E715|nr:hypothetical protein [Duganella sp. HH101]OFA06887.1 hypothetical protein DUGA2_02190 [Duganella sp. HH101]
MNPQDHTDDAAFEDFLKGEGDLARQLQRLPQPPVPEALSAAILARAAADLGDGARAGASANDAVHGGAPVAPPARHYLRRARVPLGLAASVVLALFMVRGLMPQAFEPGVRQDGVVQESAPPAAKMAEVAPNRDVAETTVAIAEPAAAPVPAQAPKPPPPPPRLSVASAPVRAAKPAASMPPLAEPAPMADIAPVPSLAMRSAPPPAPPESSLSFSAPAPVLARAPVPAHAALPGPEVMSVSAALSAPAWLARMAEMLKAGQTKEAHAEWLKFRMRYPDVEVSPELQRQLETVN